MVFRLPVSNMVNQHRLATRWSCSKAGSGARTQYGTLLVRHVRGQSPDVTWPVTQSRFKALVYLHSGTNIFSHEFSPSGSRSQGFGSNIRLI